MEKTYSAAVIGLGFIGGGDQMSGDAIGQQVANLDGTHAAAFSAHPCVRLVAGSSRDEGRRTRFAQRHEGAKLYAHWREMLAAEHPDIVSIATNSPQHAEITIACAEAGVRAVLCEKPIATRLADADKVIEACRSAGTLLSVNHTRRWHPLWGKAREEILSLGEVHHVLAQWPSGRLGNIGTHMFDAAAFLLDETPVAVSGTLDLSDLKDCRGSEYNDPGGWGLVHFSGGTKMFVDAGHSVKAPNTLRIVGSLGALTIRKNKAQMEWNSGESRRLTIPTERSSSAFLAVEDLIGCLNHGTQPASTGEDARLALEAVIGFHVSHRHQGRLIPLPLKGADRAFEVRIG